MRSSELHEALKRARMKTETKNGVEKPKNPPQKEDERPSPVETGGSKSNDRFPSPTVEKQPKKQTKAKAPLNLDSGNNIFS